MGNIFSGIFTNKDAEEDQYRFWSAVASSLHLGWLGTDDKEKEMKMCQLTVFPILLNASALQGDIVGIRTHMQQGADVSVPDSRGRTPLHLAAAESDVETVKFLIGEGADISARDCSGGTPLLDAIRCKNYDVVTLLINEGAVLEMSDSELGAEMCCLAYLGDTEQMKAWKLAGVSFNLADIDGRTPLHVAVCTNQKEMVKYCIMNGSNLELRDNYNNRPVDDAERLGYKNLVQMLTNKGKQPQ